MMVFDQKHPHNGYALAKMINAAANAATSLSELITSPR